MEPNDLTYDEMLEYLDQYLDGAASGNEMSTKGFIVQTYFILQKLIADVQKMQDHMHWSHSCLTSKPSVN